MSREHHHLKAILFALTGVTLWVIGDANMKLAASFGAPKQEIMALSGLAGMAVVFLAAARGDMKKLRLQRVPGMLVLCVCSLICLVAWLVGLPRMPMADYYAIIFLMPMVVACIASVFLREPLGWKKALAIFAGFIGVIIAVDPGAAAASRDAIGYIAVFIGMLMLSAQMVIIRIMGAYESREAMAFYPRIGATVAGIAACAIWGIGTLSMQNFLYCAVYGACSGGGWLFMAQAYKHAPAGTVAPFQYSQIITGGIVGYLIWHDVPSPHLMLGAAVIIASGVYIAAHGRKTRTAPSA